MAPSTSAAAALPACPSSCKRTPTAKFGVELDQGAAAAASKRPRLKLDTDDAQGGSMFAGVSSANAAVRFWAGKGVSFDLPPNMH